MSFFTLFAFLFLGASFLSLWVYRNPKIWGSLLGISTLCGLIAGNVTLLGLPFLALLTLFWLLYDKKPSLVLFIIIICISALFKMKLVPGYNPLFFTSKFSIGLEGSLIGLFPLAFVTSLSKTLVDWKLSIKGLLLGCIGIVIIALFAAFAKVVNWQFTLPSFMIARTVSNLFLTSIPEEGFFRGFIQNTLCRYFENYKFGKLLALFVTSILFTASHIYWAPNIAVLAFVFIASLLYGGVYLASGKIESAILCHFLLNFIHMTFFSYHAV